MLYMKMSKNMNNKEIASLLREIAATYEIKDQNFFRVRAYQNAADSIEQTTIQLKTLWEKDQIGSIPGVGPSIKNHLDELFQKGNVEYFSQETKDIPKGMFSLIKIPGIGPKTAFKLAKHFHLENEETAAEELLQHALNNEIRNIPTFGEKSEEDIISAIQKQQNKNERLLLYEGILIADEIIDYLKKSPQVLDAQALGSLRRKSPTVGDIDIAVSTNNQNQVLDHLKNFPNIRTVLASGENLFRFTHVSNHQVDIKFQSPKEWGSTLQHYTGSKYHNIHLRSFALKNGMSLSEYGITKNGILSTYSDEKDFYQALGLNFIPPEIREDNGEIEASLENKLPNLVNLKDIKGDFHIHTNIDIKTSHDEGINNVEEILQKANSLNYLYLGLADHNPRISNLTPKDRLNLIKKRNEIINDQVYLFNQNNHTNLKVYKGLEVDIRPNGKLALEEESLELLDYVIASVHSQFDQSKDEATNRVIKALSHPKVKIFGHPTGRILLERPGLDYDWDQIFSLCHKNKIALEINASPLRLDLPDSIIRLAVKNNVKLVINTDSHQIEQMDLARFAVWQARRGWAQKQDILNALPLKEFGAFFGR
jgi:DNA polymerase (family 10)